MNRNKLFIAALLCMLSMSIFAGNKSVSYNVMISDKSGEKAVKNCMKAIDGVESVKTEAKTGMVHVEYDDEKTDISTITQAFKNAKIYASPIGENCASKPGGCLNNKPTTTNTMR